MKKELPMRTLCEEEKALLYVQAALDALVEAGLLGGRGVRITAEGAAAFAAIHASGWRPSREAVAGCLGVLAPGGAGDPDALFTLAWAWVEGALPETRKG